MFFTTYIAQPIFNLLVLIYTLLPGHNFGVAIIIFTVIIRLILWPLLYRQLHQTKVIRKLQPELKRIKKEAKGDRQKESLMVRALYKEHGVSMFGPVLIMLLQLPILFALYGGIRRILTDPNQLVSFAYPSLQHLPWMQQLAHNIHLFDATLFGIVNLTKSPLSAAGIYWPALVLILLSAVVQYCQSKQLLVTDKNARSIREIMRDASEGKEADQAEVSAAVNGLTIYLLPVMVIIFTIQLPAALGLYWLVGGLIAYFQQSLILREDVTELEAMADLPGTKRSDLIPEAEAVAVDPKPTTPKNLKIKARRNKRRKKK